MSVEEGGAYLGLLSFLSFAFSVIAAVTAIDTYRLLRSGEAGRPWRVLIISSVVFALVQVLFIVELLSPRMRFFGLSQVGQLMFALTLAYAFYLQRRLFVEAASLRRQDESRDETRPARVKRKKLQLLEEATEADAETYSAHKTNAVQVVSPQVVSPQVVSPTDLVSPTDKESTNKQVDENAVRSVSAYESDDDIEWSQIKAVSR